MFHRNKSLRVASTLVPLVATTLAIGSGAAHAQSKLVFDNFTDAAAGNNSGTVTSTGSTPNTFMGDGYTLLTGTKDITGFDLFPVNLSGTNFTGLKLTIYVWGTVNTGAVSAATPAFSNPLATYTLTSTGTYTSGFFFSFVSATPGVTPGVTLSTPLVVSNPTIGLTFNYQGTTDGTNYASVNSLTSLISTGAPATVGTELFNGYYRNANSETNGNFTSTLRSLGLTNQSESVRVYGDVASSAATPEPSAVALALPGAMLMVGGIVRRRRNRA